MGQRGEEVRVSKREEEMEREGKGKREERERERERMIGGKMRDNCREFQLHIRVFISVCI